LPKRYSFFAGVTFLIVFAACPEKMYPFIVNLLKILTKNLIKVHFIVNLLKILTKNLIKVHFIVNLNLRFLPKI